MLALKKIFPLICVTKYFNDSFNHVKRCGRFYLKKYIHALMVKLCICLNKTKKATKPLDIPFTIGKKPPKKI